MHITAISTAAAMYLKWTLEEMLKVNLFANKEEH